MIGIDMNEVSVNFYNVLNYAVENYYEEGIMNESAAILAVNSSIDPFVVIDSLNKLGINLSEASGGQVSEPKKVKEGKGYGVSIEINGKEYRYVSPEIDTDKLFKSVHGMWEHHAGFKIVQYLMKHSLCYYGNKVPSQEGRELVGYKESTIFSTINKLSRING